MHYDAGYVMMSYLELNDPESRTSFCMGCIGQDI